jgi:hypothetical protein
VTIGAGSGALGADELTELAAATVQVGGVVMAAAPSGGIGSAQEVAALAEVVSRAVRESPPGSLLNAMTEAVREITRQIQEGGVEALLGTVRDAGDTGLAACRRAAALVDAKASPEDAAAYKALLLEVANRVARAATEGGFLGIGGQQVSEPEQRALAAVADAITGEGAGGSSTA